MEFTTNLNESCDSFIKKQNTTPTNKYSTNQKNKNGITKKITQKLYKKIKKQKIKKTIAKIKKFLNKPKSPIETSTQSTTYSIIKYPDKILTQYYFMHHYIPSIKKAFKIKERDSILKVINSWNRKLYNQIEWGQDIDVISKKEIFQIKRITLSEIIKIVNLADITRKLKLKPVAGFVYAMGIVYATFIFETTSMCLTIREIYETIPIGKRRDITFLKFRKLFILDGTSKDVNEILYK